MTAADPVADPAADPDPGVHVVEDSVRDALETVGGVWPILVLAALRPGDRRYRDLRRDVAGINDRMLSQTLRRFVRDGLVDRTDAGPGSNVVRYDLTEVGTEVCDAVCHFVSVMRSVAPSVADARARHGDD